MTSIKSIIFVAAMACLVLFSSLMLVIAVDYNTAAPLTPAQALGVGAAGAAIGAILLILLFRKMRGAHGRA